MEGADLEAILLDPDKAGEWIETFLSVPTEEGRIVRFVPTPQQRMMLKAQTGRDITVKGRQTRASSLIMARNLRRMTTQYGLNCAIFTQTNQMTQLFRERIKHHLEDLARHDLKYEITRDSDEGLTLGRMYNHFFFGSAEQRTGPRGIQTAHIVHCSEVAFWPEDRAKTIFGALIPACPPPPFGWFDIESTPNGAGGLFYKYATDARPLVPLSKWTVHFYPWWLEATYTIESYRALYPVDEMLASFRATDQEEALMRLHGLTPGQILWRRIQTLDLLKTGKYFAQEYPEDIASCFLTAGEGYFADETFDHLGYYKAQTHPAPFTATALKYRDSEVSFRGGLLQIWEPPVAGATYAAFVDCAAGFSGGEESDADYTAIAVLNVKTKHHVATLRVRTTPERAGEMACAIGMLYNAAYLGIERNGYGSGALAKAKELQYPNLFYDIIANPKKPELGWWTCETSRDMMLRTLREAVFEHSLVTHDLALVMEMGSFTWVNIKQRGERPYRAEHASGAHDDLLFAVAGALTIAPYAPTRIHSSAGVIRKGQGAHRPWMR
jgi:hypothetical protein